MTNQQTSTAPAAQAGNAKPNIPASLMEQAKAASLKPWGCVESRPMYVNYDADFNDWHVSPMFFEPGNEDNCQSFARAERGNLILL